MKGYKGFSLVELIIVIIITAIIAGIAGIGLEAGFRGYFTAASISSLNGKSSIAMLYMSKELKKAFAFTSINSNNISFSTTDGNTVTYSLTGTTLNRSENGGDPIILSSQVSGLSFSYYDKNQQVVATPALVRAVTISMTMQGSISNLSLINTVYLGNMS
jgi:prepilin-type N-terminal cleavage/methylation domain-containing protein